MPIQLRHYFLILLLALLQCLTPLLHAHAGGLHASSHVHLHVDGWSAHHSAHGPELSVDLRELPVVCVASEFKRDSLSEEGVAPLSAAAWRIVPPLVPVAATVSISPLPFSASLYSGPPPSQAPPV